MKCPSCGAEITSGRFCESCGSQITPDMLRDQELLNKQGCPKCGSTNIQIRRENQGEIRGKNSKKVLHQTVAFCKDCGYTWYPNGQQKPRKTWLWVLGWIFIFPLPLTLILLKKKNLHPAIKYGVIAVAWILYLLFAFSGKASNEKATENVIDNPVPASSEGINADGNNTAETKAVTEKETVNTTINTTNAAKEKFVITGEELGEFGRKVVLNGNTDMPVDKYLYKLPAGTYTVTTTNIKISAFSIVKDEIGIEEGNADYPEILQYVGQQYLLTSGEDNLNGNASKSVVVTLKEDESFQLVGDDTFVFEKE